MAGETENKTGAADLTAEDLRRSRRAIEHCYASGWTDGLPIVPPTEESVNEFLSHTRIFRSLPPAQEQKFAKQFQDVISF